MTRIALHIVTTHTIPFIIQNRCSRKYQKEYNPTCTHLQIQIRNKNKVLSQAKFLNKTADTAQADQQQQRVTTAPIIKTNDSTASIGYMAAAMPREMQRLLADRPSPTRSSRASSTRPRPVLPDRGALGERHPTSVTASRH